MSTAILILLAATSMIAGLLGSISGFGVSVLMMPVLVFALGERDAVPALTIATLVGNLSRVGLNFRLIRLSASAWYLLGAIPAAWLGGHFFSSASGKLILLLMAAFLVGAVVVRHFKARQEKAPLMPQHRLAWVGLVTGAISALVGGAGPMVVPFFLATGLSKGAFIGTEALAAMGVHITKLFAYGSAQVLTAQSLWAGAAIALPIIAGSWAGKRIIDRVDERTFHRIIDVMLILAAATLLTKAIGQ
jgi:uncharacterized membrane protein YfcA